MTTREPTSFDWAVIGAIQLWPLATVALCMSMFLVAVRMVTP